jgi:hypothetical protein
MRCFLREVAIEQKIMAVGVLGGSIILLSKQKSYPKIRRVE